jgi:large conductance mechanosensitive channel
MGMSFAKEFREFAVKGNAIDMAVGIIIGAAFGKIVSSLVSDVIMPPVGILLGGVDFRNLKLMLKEATVEAPAVTLNYGQFINSVVDFLIVSIAIFLVIKGLNSIKRR